MHLSTVDEDLRALTQLLWRYRELLEAVEYHLDVQHLLVANGRDRWVARTADQLGAVVDEVVRLDRERETMVARLAAALGRPGSPSLSELVAHVPAPWPDIMAEHLEALSRSVHRVSDTARRTRTSLLVGLEAIHELLRSLGGGGGGGYDRVGRAAPAAGTVALLFDDRA